MVWEHFTGRVRPTDDPLAVVSVDELRSEARRLVDQAKGASWYQDPANDVDRALFVLCHLRRSAASEARLPEAGDEAVRDVLVRAKPEALAWLASRVVSYMDEQGFPETLEPWLSRR